MQIYITNLFSMQHEIERFRPTHVVSLIQAQFQPDRPAQIRPENHLRLEVHDIVDRSQRGILPAHADVHRLVQFLSDWCHTDGHLLTHCYAGISRSTAAALIALYLRTGNALESGRVLRQAAPHARPNRLIVRIADEILATGGALARSVEAMGPSEPLYEAPLAIISLDDDSVPDPDLDSDDLDRPLISPQD